MRPTGKAVPARSAHRPTRTQRARAWRRRQDRVACHQPTRPPLDAPAPAVSRWGRRLGAADPDPLAHAARRGHGRRRGRRRDRSVGCRRRPGSDHGRLWGGLGHRTPAHGPHPHPWFDRGIGAFGPSRRPDGRWHRRRCRGVGRSSARN